MRNVLVFAAHPDDEILGVGGTVRRLVNEGICVRSVIMAEGLTSRNDKREDTGKSELVELQKDALNASKEVGYTSIDFCGLPDNRMDGIDLLHIVKIISSYVQKYSPDTIFTHHHGDLNIDHQKTCEAVLTACRPVGQYMVERIYAFETPSSTEWNFKYNEPFRPNVFFEITDTIEAKIKGMACYKTECAVYPHPRSLEALRLLSKYRGTQIGVDMAEGFELLREVMPINRKFEIVG